MTKEEIIELLNKIITEDRIEISLRATDREDQANSYAIGEIRQLAQQVLIRLAK